MRTQLARYDGEGLNSICVRIQHALSTTPGSAVQFDGSEIEPVSEFMGEFHRRPRPRRIVDIGESEAPADK